jgi:DNA polymerase epsilon subunit 4
VQKIIQADPERLTVTKNASFAIALATEMFVQHLSITTHNVVKTERKPRRNIQYRDVSSAVSRTDSLEFLVDVVPKTVQYGAYKRKKAVRDEELALREKEGLTAVLGEKDKGKGKAVMGNGETQTTLPGISMQSGAAKELLARAGNGQTTTTTTVASTAETAETPQNGAQLDPLARKELVPPVPETEAMDVDDERVADSEGEGEGEGEEDPAAMQIEMEMRGQPAQHGKGKAPSESVSASPAPRVSSGGFTAINGR